jgi:hexosaminidase
MPRMISSAMSNFESRHLRRFRLPLSTAYLFAAGMTAFASVPSTTLMPVPTEVEYGSGRLVVSPAFKMLVRGHDDARLRDGLARLLHRTEERTGLTFARLPTGDYAFSDNGEAATCVIECAAPGSAVPVLGENESYTLDISSTQAVLRAPTVLGVLHGGETLLQLLESDSTGWFLPAVSLKDQPRFPWRGLLIDVARHWQPMEVIKRNLDGMALVKLNVLHLHLTEDQGFRIESKKFPRLQELGSDGHYFTQAQMREIIGYAAARGIRIVPEFDIPGHATSWVVGFPGLASAAGPYAIQRRWGVFDPVLDPTNPKVYKLLDGFLGEMAALFPDAYIHIGGDENNGVQWSASPKIQAFIKEHRLKDNAGLHAYFNIRVHAILAKYGKKLIGWDEILHPDLPAGSAVHSWRGPDGIAEATKRGYPVILSNGYYIDLCHPAWEHYLNDPVPAGTALTDPQQKLVLGGEATMWAEWVTPETIDSRIWPRTAAIAERLWSPREVRDVPDMYRRLALVSHRLEETGLHHERYLEPALRRLAGDAASLADLEALRTLVNLLEPVKDYRRGGQQPDATQFTPLTGLVDCTRPDSAAARAFASQVDATVFGTTAADSKPTAIQQQLAEWRSAAALLATGLAVRSPRLQEAAPLLLALTSATEVGEESVQALTSGRVPAQGWLQTQFAKLDQAAQPHAAAELPVIAVLKLLVAAAAEQDKRGAFSAEEWKQHLLGVVTPPAKPAATAH